MKKFLVITAGVLVLGFNGSAVALESKCYVCLNLNDPNSCIECEELAELSRQAFIGSTDTSTSDSTSTTTDSSDGSALTSFSTNISFTKPTSNNQDTSNGPR